MDNNIVPRINKDIELFKKNIARLATKDSKAAKVMELSKMYAKDAESYLGKKDYYTAFSCISYAHGLLDALTELYGA
jgi:hypothetical protein